MVTVLLDQDDQPAPVKRGPGRPRKVAQAQAAPAPQRVAARQTVRDPVREAPRTARTGAVVVTGHHGEVLTRKRKGTADPFTIDMSTVPAGWEYQWNAVSVIGNTEVLMDQNLMMAENGWRPVPASRHEGRYMPVGHKGSIIRGGQRLDERPKALSDEARAEDIARARRQMADRDQSLMGGKANLSGNMPEGSMNPRQYRGTGGGAKISVDPGVNIPRTELPLAGPEE